MAAALTHVALHARDVDRAVRFYADYAGLVEVHRRTEHGTTVAWLGEPARPGDFVIVLLGAPHTDPVVPAPLAHLGYAVRSRDEVDRLASRARAEGTLLEGPRDGGAVVGYFCIIQDPDGNWVEFSYGQALGPTAQRLRQDQ
jgi:catechol 2,3-dioxygenase-like lactoylglutathione lyase family enzyme